MKHLGNLRKIQRQYVEAIHSYEAALDMSELLYKHRRHAEVADCLTQLGHLYKLQNDFKKSISVFEEAIRIQKNLMTSMLDENDDGEDKSLH